MEKIARATRGSFLLSKIPIRESVELSTVKTVNVLASLVSNGIFNYAFNCYECEFREKVPGSAHSCCKHPEVAKILEEPMGQVLSILASVGRIPAITKGTEKLNIKGNSYGIKEGWFNWPYNFDPVWLENCDGFTPKKENEK